MCISTVSSQEAAMHNKKLTKALPVNRYLVNNTGKDSIWKRADDAYFVGEIYTLQELSVWFAEKAFLSTDIVQAKF